MCVNDGNYGEKVVEEKSFDGSAVYLRIKFDFAKRKEKMLHDEIEFSALRRYCATRLTLLCRDITAAAIFE